MNLVFLTPFKDTWRRLAPGVRNVVCRRLPPGVRNVVFSSNYTVVTVFIAHFSRVIHSAEIDRLTAL